STEFGLFRHKLNIGAIFLQANTDGLLAQDSSSLFYREVNQPDFYLDMNAGEFAVFVEWTENRTHLSHFYVPPADTEHTGHAVYGSLSYSNDVVGLTLEYKNYQYFVHPVG